MNMNSRLMKALIAAASALVVLFFFFKAVNIISEEYDTVSAEETSVYDTLDAKAYLVRDEIMLYNSGGGTVVPTASNAEKVNANSPVAVTFLNSNAANAYTQLSYLKDVQESYRLISEQTEFTNVDMVALAGKIDSDYKSIIETVYDSDYSSIGDLKLSLLVDVSRRQVSLGTKINCEEKISEIQNRIAALETQAVQQNIISAGSSGYYISNADGYESVIQVSMLNEIKSDEIEKAINSKPQAVAESCVGKVMNGFYWYLATVVDTNDANALKEGETINVIIGNTGSEKIKTEIERVYKENDNKTVVILRSNSISADILTSRIVNAKLIVNEYSGLKVPQKAVRVVDGNQCCYVRVGNVTKLRYMNVIYSCSDYVIAFDDGKTTFPGAQLRKHDNIILNGKGLGNSA